ncbi:MAG TPA: nitroreductase family protein [Candidatus Binatia bacterium]|nr:nitroreductase family protein [Candidatus Binatia bacterium]
MEFAEAVRRRRMVRNFEDKPVDPDVVERILELAQHNPSAGFTQGQDYVVVRRPNLKQEIAALAHEEDYVEGGFDAFVSGAPVLIVPCTNEAAYHRRYQEKDKVDEEGKEIDWPVPYWFMDVGCAVMILLLAVVDEGLAAAFVGIPDLEALKQLLDIPAEVSPVGVITIGHPAPDKRSPSLRRGRRVQSNVVHFESW